MATGALIGLGVMSGFGAYEKSQQEKAAAQAREQAITLRMQQEQIAANQRTTNEMDQVNRLMARQDAVGAATGAFGSPSFEAIQTDTLNEFAKDENANNLNLTFQKEAGEQDIQNVKQAEKAQQWGNLIDFGSQVANLFSLGEGGFSKAGVPRGAQGSSLPGLPPPDFTGAG